MKSILIVTAMLPWALPPAIANVDVAADEIHTWTVSHPELFEIFGRPFTAEGALHRKTTFVPWHLDDIDKSGVQASQPGVFKGPNGELIANGVNTIVQSTDNGRTWVALGAPSLEPDVPSGRKHMLTNLGAVGMTRDGTIVAQISTQHNDGRRYEGLSDPTYRVDTYVTRSTDAGKTWEPRVQLNDAPLENSSSCSMRFFNLPDGKIGLTMGVWYQQASGEPMPLSDYYMQTYLFSSADEGNTWQRRASPTPICLYGEEPDVLVLDSGRMLAVVRYQRHKLPHDPENLASPHLMRYDEMGFWYKSPYTLAKEVGRGLVARFTAVLHSDDGGKTWTEPRIVTGFDEQTGCLVQLSDGTVILVFGHKTDGLGQRFMLSYDDGITWSRKVFQLHRTGQYASSVVLDDDTIVTVIHKGKARELHALSWQAPTRNEVAKGGFWRPRPAEPLGIAATVTEETTTWADFHPEVVERFSKPLTPWPAEVFTTPDIAVNQPTVVLGPDGHLYANCYSVKSWAHGMVARSTDGGRTWARMGRPVNLQLTPRGDTPKRQVFNGVGVTHRGTLLLIRTDQYTRLHPSGKYDPVLHSDVYVTRSTDGGHTWSAVKLNAHVEGSGGNVTRIARLADDVMAILMPVFPQATANNPVPKSERYDRTYMWTSRDDGVTWQRSERPITLYGCEPDLLQLSSGRLLAAIRYQRYKLPHDPPSVASPHLMRNDVPPYAKAKQIARGLAVRGTAILWSDDDGRTWTKPRLVTALDEQTGCLVKLSDGTVLLVFGSKNNALGQRCMISYDEGETWSKTIYDLHTGGMYASSAVLADDTIVTFIDSRQQKNGVNVMPLNLTISALRWKAPLRSDVERGGFWTPRDVDPLDVRPSE